jgi:ubiquinone/menaquinone biosynthesis C-methylase UbiE
MIEYNWDKELCRNYANGLRPMVKFDHKPIARAIFKYLDNKPHQTVVDIAAGPGFLILELAGLMDSPVLIAQDAAMEMLEIAKEEAGKIGMDICLCTCPAEKIELSDNIADAVVCKQLLHEASDPQKVISEISRILKPGGKAFVIDFDEDGSRLAAHIIKLLLRVVSGKLIAESFWKSFSRGLKGSIVKTYLENSGFKKVLYKKRGPNYFLAAFK